ncbi:hypothetical protein ACSBR2_010858 [Camellia fascicularis]
MSFRAPCNLPKSQSKWTVDFRDSVSKSSNGTVISRDSLMTVSLYNEIEADYFSAFYSSLEDLNSRSRSTTVNRAFSSSPIYYGVLSELKPASTVTFYGVRRVLSLCVSLTHFNGRICALIYVVFVTHFNLQLYILYLFEEIQLKVLLGLHWISANGVVIATEKKLPSILVDEASVQKIQILTPNIGVLYSGMGPDSRVLVRKSRKQAEQYHRLYKEPIPVTQLVRETTAVMQEFTQSGGVRPFGVSLLVAGFDDKVPQLYQVDPSGSYFSWKASAMGKNVSNAKSFLEKRHYGSNTRTLIRSLLHDGRYLRRGLKLRVGGSYTREYRHLVDAAAHMELMMQEEDEEKHRGSKRSQDGQGDGRRQRGYNP